MTAASSEAAQPPQQTPADDVQPSGVDKTSQLRSSLRRVVSRVVASRQLN